LAALPVLVAATGTLLPYPDLLWKASVALVLAVALLDWTGTRQPVDLRVRREVPSALPLGVWSEVRLRVHNGFAVPCQVALHDHVPETLQMEGLPGGCRLAPGTGVLVPYRVRPLRRGEVEFPGIDLILRSPRGLWECVRFTPLPETVRVLPNTREIGRFSLLARDNRLSRIGVRRRLRRGEGADFHQLREYRVGDPLRQVDWNASARLRRLISKDYEDARDQQVVFLLDCGRRMRHRGAAGRSHLDEALNALLLLSHVAIRQGDGVGLLSFGGTQRWLAPQRGEPRLRELLRYTFDLQPTREASDYIGAARTLLARQPRRALLVILTNTRDDANADLLGAIRLLRRHHLVVIADLREEALDRALRSPLASLSDALLFQGINDYLTSRRRNFEALLHSGAIPLDVLPTQLPGALVNRYLDAKASGAL
jgi:uncharacterized protein (DUF58 family)